MTDKLAELEKLKSEYTKTYPGVTDAMDIAAMALVEIMQENDENISPLNVTKHMFQAVMTKGFMIIQRDEVQSTIMAAVRADRIMNKKDDAP